jgi:porin
MSLNLPLSIFNVTALGVRVKLKRSGNVTYLAAIYDGDPGDPNENSDGFNIIIDRGTEGFLTIAEVQTGHTGEEPGFSPNALRVGGWYHSGEFEDARARAGLIAEKKHSGNMGFYATADRTMLSRKSGRQLGLFAQAGFTLPDAQDRNEVLLYLGGGINLKSILEMRPDDVFGVAIAYARISDDFASAERQATGKSRTGETALEITYRAQIYPWLTVQPDYQAVINPGGRTDVTTAHIASLRFEILF